MSTTNLGRTLERYSATLTALEEARPRPSAEQVLAVLKARDGVHAALTDTAQDPVGGLIAIVQLDSRLKRQAERITHTAKLAEWRTSFNPPAQAWWWSLEAPTSRWDHFDWLWSALAIICLTISLSLAVDISSRFLSGGPDTWGAFAVIGQSVLTLLAAGGTLTKAGREAIERVLASLKVPTQFWQEANLGLAVLLLVALVMFRFSLPGIAVWYNDDGLKNHSAGRLTSAQFDYLRAIRLNPDYVEAHYNLGLLYEDLQQLDQARTEYRAAVQGGLAAAHNNLARLYILEEDYVAAVPLLKRGLLIADDEAVKYDLHKNLGWVRLGQARYDEARVELQVAIAFVADQAPAHCLLAQVLEGYDDTAGARGEWEICLKYADPMRPDEDTWIGLARQRLAGEGK